MGSDKHFADVMKRRELATEIFVRAGTEFDDSDDLARPAGWLRSCCWPRGCSNHGDVFRFSTTVPQKRHEYVPSIALDAIDERLPCCVARISSVSAEGAFCAGGRTSSSPA